MSKQVIQEHAKRVASRTIQDLISTTMAKDKLDELLRPYTTIKNQYTFLRALQTEADQSLAEHRKTCKKIDCQQIKGFGYLNFAIDQELDNLSTYYSPGDDGNVKEFSTEEKLKVHEKIEQVLEELKNMGLGQQILFEEVNNLREHFNLDKKNWVQLLKGKLLDLTAEKIIEFTVADLIFRTVTESIQAGQFLLPK